MRSVVIRTGVGCYRYLVASLRKAAGGTYTTISDTTYQQYVDKLSYHPMFTKYYLVEIVYHPDPKFDDFIFNTLLKSAWIQCVIYTDNREVFEQLQERCHKLNVLFFNSYDVSDEYLIKYIRKYVWDATDHKIKLSYDTAKYIRKRIKFQDYLLDSKLDLLIHTDFSRQTIRAMIPLYRGVKLSTFPLHFFLGDRKEEIMSFLVRYQRSIDYLYKPLVEFVTTWLQLYEKYLAGEISPMNYTQWMLVNGDRYGIKYKYQIENWMKLFNLYSYDLVTWIRTQLYFHKDDSSFFKTLFLFKLTRGLYDGIV